MAFNYSPKVTKDGLVLYLDAANPKSYPGTGDYWYDLSGFGTVLTRSTTNLVTSNMGGAIAFNFDTYGENFTGTLLGTAPSTNCTIEAWIYPAASELQIDDRGCIVLLYGINGLYMSWNKSNQKLSSYWYGHPNEGYHENAAASNRSVWNHWASVWDYNAGVLRQYTNGIKASTDASTQGNASSGNVLVIGQESTSRQFSGGISIIRIYNTALTTSQVVQNYNATKSRFNLT